MKTNINYEQFYIFYMKLLLKYTHLSDNMAGDPRIYLFIYITSPFDKFTQNDMYTKQNKTKYNTIQYNTIQYNTIQYNTTQYNTIQHKTAQYSIVQYNTYSTM
jgi:hypothetical protein